MKRTVVVLVLWVILAWPVGARGEVQVAYAQSGACTGTPESSEVTVDGAGNVVFHNGVKDCRYRVWNSEPDGDIASITTESGFSYNGYFQVDVLKPDLSRGARDIGYITLSPGTYGRIDLDGGITGSIGTMSLAPRTYIGTFSIRGQITTPQSIEGHIDGSLYLEGGVAEGVGFVFRRDNHGGTVYVGLSSDPSGTPLAGAIGFDGDCNTNVIIRGNMTTAGSHVRYSRNKTAALTLNGALQAGYFNLPPSGYENSGPVTINNNDLVGKTLTFNCVNKGTVTLNQGLADRYRLAGCRTPA